MSFPGLETDRLTLRAFAPDDLDDVAAMYADPEVVRFIGDGTAATREGSAEWLGLRVQLCSMTRPPGGPMDG
ncbi:MAG: GNAT family N-acetyltransferase [Candidatus Velamenicoccus archaeovorus]